MDDLVESLRDAAADAAAEEYGVSGLLAEAAAEIERLRAEVEAVWAAMPRDSRYLDPPDGGCVPLHEQVRRMAADATRAERLAEALLELMLNSPGGHSCEEFHHYKSDRHMPGDDCPAQLRWNKAVTTAQAALRDHDQENQRE